MRNDRDNYDQQYVSTHVAETPAVTLDDEVEQDRTILVKDERLDGPVY